MAQHPYSEDRMTANESKPPATSAAGSANSDVPNSSSSCLNGDKLREKNERTENDARFFGASNPNQKLERMQLDRDLVLTTKSLVLRPLDVGDLELLWDDISDSEISRLMAWNAHREKSETCEFLKTEVQRRKRGQGITWAIMKGGSFCGIVSLIGILHGHRALIYDRAELAYWLSRRYHGQGIMTGACRRVLRFAFETLELHKVFVSHFADNEASAKLIKRLGFRYVGEQIEEFSKNGVWHNHKLYELLDREFIE